MMRKYYTAAEWLLNREAGENKARLLTATWVKGKGPRGGKVNIGEERYGALDLLCIEGKAEAVVRFSGKPHFAGLDIQVIVVRFPKLKGEQKLEPVNTEHAIGPNWEKAPWD